MSRIRGKDTRPEMQLRSLLYRAGYRFRLHHPGLPGRPDIVLTKYRTAVFVHGCYWHRHQGCPYATTPKSHKEFWEKKFSDTIKRDRQNVDELVQLGWRVITVWECELKKNSELVLQRISQRLEEDSNGT